MIIYVTKYALTKGILKFTENIEIPENLSGLCVIRTPGNSSKCFHGEGKEWHREYISAFKRAIVMKEAKIKSLKKQINKLEKLTF